MNILHIVKRSKAYWIGHILRSNCVLKVVIEEKLEGTRRQGRRRRRFVQLLDYFKEKRRIEKMLDVEGGSSRSHPLDNWLWKYILTCCRTDCVMTVGKIVSHFEDTNQKIFPGTAVSSGSKQKGSLLSKRLCKTP